MKYTLFIFCFVTMLLSCSEKKEAKRIPLTSTSKEAIENYNQGVFRDEQLENDESNASFKKAFELDSNFALAKINYNNPTDPADNKKRLVDAYNNRAKLSEIESVIVSIKYETTINNDYAKSDLMMDSLIKKYPDYYELYLNSAYIKNKLNNTDGCMNRFKEALNVNPECYAAALSLPDLHSTNGTPSGANYFNMLPLEKRNLDEAEKYFKLAAKIRPKAPATSRMYGNLYRTKGDLDKALEKYQESETLNTEKSSLLAQSYQMLGHVYLYKGEYDKSREYYKKYENFGIELRKKFGGNTGVSDRIALTYLYEKKYDEVILEANQILVKIDSLKIPERNKITNRFSIEDLKFATYGHSLKEEDAQASMNKLINYRIAYKMDQIKLATNQNEINRIDNAVKCDSLYYNIWFNILFAHYEEAEKKTKDFEMASTEQLKTNPKAMNRYYSLLGYLNLMEGKVNESLENFKKVIGIEDDIYFYYFYALALKAQGNKVESEKIFTKINSVYFVQWQVAIVKELAKAQLNAGN
ncbi:MAG: tetratricopeptide repeat protein [Bacteroidetes bacterium]|nr:tetratricopeptide repeat protein [Bacteroidota bacterium]